MSLESNSDYSDDELGKKVDKSLTSIKDKILRFENLNSCDAIKNNASSFFVVNTDIITMPVLRVDSREGNPWGRLADSILNPFGSKNRIILRKMLNIPEYIQGKKGKGSILSDFGSNLNLNPDQKLNNKKENNKSHASTLVSFRKRSSKQASINKARPRPRSYISKSFQDKKDKSFNIEEQADDNIDLKTVVVNRKKSCDCSKCGKPSKFQQKIQNLIPINPVKHHQVKKLEKKIIRRNASYGTQRNSLSFGRSIKIISNLKKIHQSVQRKSKKLSFSNNLTAFKPVEQGFLGLNLKLETLDAINRELGMGGGEPKSSLLKRGETMANKESPRISARLSNKRHSSKRKNKEDPDQDKRSSENESRVRTRVGSPNLNRQITLNQLALFELFSPKKERNGSINEPIIEERIEIKPLDEKLVAKIDILQKRYSLPEGGNIQRNSMTLEEKGFKKMITRTGSLCLIQSQNKESTKINPKRKNSILNESRKDLEEEDEESEESSTISQDFKLIEERLNILRMQEEQQRRKEKVYQFYNNQRLKRDTVMSDYVDLRMKGLSGETESKISGISANDIKPLEFLSIGNSVKMSYISKESVFRNKDPGLSPITINQFKQDQPRLFKPDKPIPNVIHKLYSHNKTLSLPKLDNLQFPIVKNLINKTKKKSIKHAKTNTLDVSAFKIPSTREESHRMVWPFTRFRSNPKIFPSVSSGFDLTEVDLKTNATTKSGKSFEKSFQAYNIKETPNFKKKLNSLLGPSKSTPSKKG